MPTHLIAVRLLLDIAKKILRQILNWNSPLYVRYIFELYALWGRARVKEILKSHLPLAFGDQDFAAKSGRVGGCAANTYLKPVSLHSGPRYVPVLAISAAVSIATRVACL